MTHKQRVLKEFPSAYYDAKRRAVCIYSEGIYFGEGRESEAWKEASQYVKRLNALRPPPR